VVVLVTFGIVRTFLMQHGFEGFCEMEGDRSRTVPASLTVHCTYLPLTNTSQNDHMYLPGHPCLCLLILPASALRREVETYILEGSLYHSIYTKETPCPPNL
jgi:hypothetical protein